MASTFAARFRYSEWDGTQDIPTLDADDVLASLTDDLMNFGDLQHALRNLMQRGMRNPQGDRMQGLRDLLQQLRQKRRQRLDQFDLGGVMEDVRRQLDELLAMERSTVDERLEQAGAAGGRADQTPADGEQQDGAGGEGQPGAQDGERGAARQPAAGARAQGEQGSGEPTEEQQFAEMLARIAERKQQYLDELPEDTAGQVRSLQDYEFLNPEAQHRFQELIEQLRQSMTQSFFRDIEQMVEQMSEGDLQRMKEMARALNDMLVQRMRGEQPDFDAFMQQYGDMFGPNPPQSLDELIAQMQAQMSAMQSLIGVAAGKPAPAATRVARGQARRPRAGGRAVRAGAESRLPQPPARPQQRLPVPRR